METKILDPQLIFALTRSMLEGEGVSLNIADPIISIYVQKTPGCYMIQRGRLYYDEDRTDNHFNSTKKKLETLKVRHVVISWNHRHGCRSYSWEDFCQAIKI